MKREQWINGSCTTHPAAIAILMDYKDSIGEVPGSYPKKIYTANRYTVVIEQTRTLIKISIVGESND